MIDNYRPYSLEELRAIAYLESGWGDTSKLAAILWDELESEEEVGTWPDIDKEDFIKAILDEQIRLGLVSDEQ